MPTFLSGAVTGRPSTATVPAVAVTRPAMSLSSVDLPQPLGPTNATVAPRGIASETPSTARVTRWFVDVFEGDVAEHDGVPGALPRTSSQSAPIGAGGR